MRTRHTNTDLRFEAVPALDPERLQLATFEAADFAPKQGTSMSGGLRH